MKTKQPICITRLLGLLFLATGLMTGSCTNEITDEVAPPAEEDAGRREVQLTLKNKLTLPGSTTRGIATAAENQLSTLDVYVFGSETEAGTYTFQERFAYRGDGTGSIPPNAILLPLAVDATDDSKSTGLLNLKKGLYVKLYCVANTPDLVNPATGNKLTSADFKGLKLNEGAAGAIPTLQTPGIPTETGFLSYHTPLLTETVAADVLVAPLAMSGAYTTPLDLTDPAAVSRLNVGFRLTRMVTRFDVVNNASESRFIIQSVSMGNGRRGATFFPIAVCDAQASVTPDNVITYPERTFDGAQGNQGFQPGAFYTYASPQADNGYLILKGLYQINATQQKEVSYQIPFRQQGADGKEVYLDIEHSHRYTIYITAADEYHLDFNLKVEDWADDGSVDSYEPDNKPGEVTVTIPAEFAGDTEDNYDPVRKIHTVSMSLKPGSTFEVKIGATSTLDMSKIYAGGIANKFYDWLNVSAPATRGESFLAKPEYIYTFSAVPAYVKGRYPRATIRFFDPLSGIETILYVEAVSVPQPVETKQPAKAPNGTSDNPNLFDSESFTASLYRITGSEAMVNITCPDGVSVKSFPDWLDVTKSSQVGSTWTYALTLKDRDGAAMQGEVIFTNEKKNDLETVVTVNVLEAKVTPSFTGLGAGNEVEFLNDAAPNVKMQVVDKNKVAINTRSMDGIAVKMNFNGGTAWLKHNAEVATTRAGDEQREVVFELDNTKLMGAKKVKVDMINKIGGRDTSFTIEPVLFVGTLAEETSTPIENRVDAATKTIILYKLPSNISSITLKLKSYGGSILSTNNENVTVSQPTTRNEVQQGEVESLYTLTANQIGTTMLTYSNLADPTKKETYSIQVKSTAITNGSTTVVAANNTTNTFQITSPEGCNVAVSGLGGSSAQWFTISTPTLNAGTQTLSIKQVDNSRTLMKPITLQLTNKIIGGESKTITITPTFAAPTLSKSNFTLQNIYKSYSNSSLSNTHYSTFNVSAPGGWEYYSISNSSVVSVANYTTYCQVNSIKKGTATLYFRNKSDNTKTISTSVTVARSFNSQPVWEINGYYVANVDAGESTWKNLLHSICQAGSDGDGGNTSGTPNKYKWYVPYGDDLKAILGTSSDLQAAPASIYNFLVRDNRIFTQSWSYWTYSAYDGSDKNAFTFFVENGSVIRGSSASMGNKLAVRCIMRR